MMTSSTHQRRTNRRKLSNDDHVTRHVTCGCQRQYCNSIGYDENGHIQSNVTLLRMQVDNPVDIMTSKLRYQTPKKTELQENVQSSIRRFCTNIIPNLSLWKILLMIQLFLVLIQINRCESTAKWWSIASIPTAPGSLSYSRRQNRHHSALLSRHRDAVSPGSKATNSGDFDLTNDKIKAILVNSEINSPKISEGRGSFPNQNKRNTNTNRKKTKERRNKHLSKSFSANLKPPTLADQRVQLLNRKQKRLLRKNPGALDEIIMGLKAAVKECKFQFRNRRWICQTDPRDSSLFGKILNRGFRETAYIYAITSAAVSHAIAKGCSQGRIATCGCEHKRGAGGPGWEWGGCSDNFKFARKFAREFVDAAEVGNDLNYRMNLHNNKVGRQIVEDEGKKFCKCHGMSGSCTLKTCWLQVSPFKTVGRKLRDKFDDAERVSISNHGTVGKRDSGLVPAIRGRRPPRKGDLVYFENSPSFCVKNSEYWATGTRGRVCNATSSGYNGCESMCCGRGYRTRIKTVKQDCKCEFEWCCRVNCQVCEVEKEISTCK